MAAKRSPAKRRKPTATRSTAARRPSKRRWSGKVTKGSDALDLQDRVFTRRDPQAIARSLKRSAERSQRRKGKPYQSAMSMLNFYINRAGQTLPAAQKKILNQAKTALRALFGRS